MSTATSSGNAEEIKRVTTKTYQELKKQDIPITMLTAYDYTSAMILDGAGVDGILVGDSASNVIAGHETTVPITLDQMIYHAQCVVRGVKRALVVVDLPFGSYQGDSKVALHSAIRIMKETGAHAVKMEGGEPVASTVTRIINAGIPVMGHLGLTPQSIYKFGTYKVRAREKEEADQLVNDIKILEKSGCFGVVLEKIPSALAEAATKAVNIPTIGIGAGPACSGQILVTHDMLGLTTEFNPRFVRKYDQLGERMSSAIQSYVSDVREKTFPSESESYT